jgi:hypothetical protein
MKKTYTTPALVGSGDVVEETRGGMITVDEEANPQTKNGIAGSIGYYL